MSAEIAVQRGVPPRGIPAPSTLRQWARAALGRVAGELTLRVVGRAESRRLNRTYRGLDRPTNVLSFSFDRTPRPRAGARGCRAPRGREPILGDIVICAPVVNAEARAQRKPPRAHWAHMVVHGVLHLLGHDHVRPREAQRMEARERRILAGLSFPDPYRAAAP